MTRTVFRLSQPPTMVQCEVAMDMATYASHYQRYRKSRFKELGKDAANCGSFARYEINGVKMCGRHAGVKALLMLMGEDDCDTEYTRTDTVDAKLQVAEEMASYLDIIMSV